MRLLLLLVAVVEVLLLCVLLLLLPYCTAAIRCLHSHCLNSHTPTANAAAAKGSALAEEGAGLWVGGGVVTDGRWGVGRQRGVVH